jgi:hypothetical protein
MIAIHLPQAAVIKVLETHAHEGSPTEGAHLKLHAVVRQPNALYLSISKVCIYYGSIRVDYEA